MRGWVEEELERLYRHPLPLVLDPQAWTQLGQESVLVRLAVVV